MREEGFLASGVDQDDRESERDRLDGPGIDSQRPCGLSRRQRNEDEGWARRND